MPTKKEKARILMVVPTLGQRPDLLKESLLAIKAQHPTPYDIALVYPLKNKATAKLAKQFNAISVNDPGGLAAAVNVGISQAQPWHEYIGWIGDDDLVAPGSLSVGMEALDKDPEAVVAYGYLDYIDSDGNKVITNKVGRLAPWLMTWGPNLMPCPGTVFRLSALKKAGNFDENNKWSMDLDMFLRLKKLGKFVNTKRVMASFRWHATSNTVSNRDVVVLETEAVKRKYLPKTVRPFAILWELPVRWATKFAAKRMNKLASQTQK